MLVLVKGAGDLATGVACRLQRAGIKVIMTDIAQPTVIRRSVAFATAIYEGTATVEGITAVHVENGLQAMMTLEKGQIPVLVDERAQIARELSFDALVDAVLAKRNLGTRLDDAPIVLALGPGFTAGQDCHAAIETQRGHHLGRVLYEGSPEPNTGVPGDIGGYSTDRVLHSPCSGVFHEIAAIGDIVHKGQPLARVGETEVPATLDGVLRGLLHDGLPVTAGMKIGDIDPRAQVAHCYSVSDKARSLGGAVLEGLLYFSADRKG